MPVTTISSRILRLHRSETAPWPEIERWSEGDLLAVVSDLLAKSSSAEAVAVLQVVPADPPELKTAAGMRRSERRIAQLAEHCRSVVRRYDHVGIRNWSVSIVMWGVTADEAIPRSVAHRIQGALPGSSVTAPPCIVGAAIGRPGNDAQQLVQSSERAVSQAKWTAEPVQVLGAPAPSSLEVDADAGVDIALSPLLDVGSPTGSKVVGRMVLCSERRRRTDFFSHPGSSVLDRLLVGIESVATLLDQPYPGWDDLHLELPLSVLRSSNTTPKVVESVMAELRDPERLTLALTGPGGPEMYAVVQDLLEPMRSVGVSIERVWDYQLAANDDADVVGSTIVRVGADTTGFFIGRDNPTRLLADGPVSLASTLGASVLVEGGFHENAIEVASDAGVRLITGAAVGQTRYEPLRGVNLQPA